ncbi:hypothetical protein Tdes44962_MAKER00026 [Teratosphaeria destructans]|uniref:Uncharacterized protein n=1 Tax=Teratosphaeria destructans TaxID=418781 RepID=A0A9W7T357_9PEZI|nr:hypothetical protein Tdes44962_MAKER00026 [Teratosphaeria destructans]
MIQMAPNLTPDERQLLNEAIFHGANRSAELIDALFFAQALVRETIAECSTLGIPVTKEHIALEDQTKVFRQNSNIRNCGHRLCGLRCEATLRDTTKSLIWRAVNLRCGLRKKACALLAAQQAVARDLKEQVWKAAKAERGGGNGGGASASWEVRA